MTQDGAAPDDGRDYLGSLYDILEVLSSIRETDENKVWVRVTEKLSVALDTEGATYYIVAARGRELLPHYSLGVPAEDLPKLKLELGVGIAGWVGAHREPALVEDVGRDRRFLKTADEATGFATRSALCVPLMDRLDLVGVLELLNPRAGAFTRGDLRFVSEVCRQTSQSLRILRLESMLNKVTAHNASILDNLTGGFLAVDLRGKVMICNPAARRILELREEIVNQNADQALAHVAGLSDILMKALVTRQIVKRQELVWSFQGDRRVLGFSTLLIQDPQGAFTGAGIMFQDITHVERRA